MRTASIIRALMTTWCYIPEGSHLHSLPGECEISNNSENDIFYYGIKNKLADR
jgi:hypothetical protein